MNAFKYFIGIIILQLFYSFGITLLSHAIIGMDPTYSAYLSPYSESATSIKNITNQIEGSLSSQMNIPVIDLGALVFYSGNIIVDLMMNFFFAVPSLFTLAINTILNIFPLDAYLATYFKLFLFSIFSILYFISVLAFLTNLRARGSIV